MNPVTVTQGNGPIILGLPHTGTYVPDAIRANLNERGRELSDTDWHIEKLYDGLLGGVTAVRANFHRYVIDANRDPSGASLYPGQNTTGLVPLTDFDGHSIWSTPPDENEIESRRLAFHAPYHAALNAEMQRVHATHGIAILYDCHSIRSQIPFLFEGLLPDFNVGTNNGSTCAPEIEVSVTKICSKAEGYTSVLNGRFKGGWTTRHYGQLQKNWHAIQMELAQSAYLKSEVAPWIYDEEKSAKLRIHLQDILSTLSHLAFQLGRKS
jgi:N-formylglutamate deformylase